MVIGPVDETDMLVGIGGFYDDNKFGGEAEILHDVEGVDGEVVDAVVGDLRLVHCVEVESEESGEENEKEKAAIAAAYAPETAAGARLFVVGGVVSGDVPAVRWGPEASLVLREHGIVCLVAGLHG
ncbi:hypothetical protein PanWU01x14_352750 [Parasponia andersonii]|uniref:Uncharacterized protein n=1 Tax=Parasponia andersonii TaxID=3476 RepID=A0A2P5AA64_PARAD|nr:hypothetical protein PanWU01x14_352750 [Parasponia andersonii]